MVHVYLVAIIVIVCIGAITLASILLVNQMKQQQMIDMQRWFEEIAIKKIYDEIDNRMDSLLDNTITKSVEMAKKLQKGLFEENDEE